MFYQTASDGGADKGSSAANLPPPAVITPQSDMSAQEPPPAPLHVNPSPYADPPASHGDQPKNSVEKMKNWLVSAGRTVFHGMEYVGEIVASVLGIDEVSPVGKA